MAPLDIDPLKGAPMFANPPACKRGLPEQLGGNWAVWESVPFGTRRIPHTLVQSSTLRPVRVKPLVACDRYATSQRPGPALKS